MGYCRLIIVPVPPVIVKISEEKDPDANYTEDKGDFEIPTDMPDEGEAPDEQDTEPI